ncbi:hypothetical protein HVZ60_04175 [Escherichia coli]|nr:hypothetical protein [Escherichia coli]
MAKAHHNSSVMQGDQTPPASGKSRSNHHQRRGAVCNWVTGIYDDDKSLKIIFSGKTTQKRGKRTTGEIRAMCVWP